MKCRQLNGKLIRSGVAQRPKAPALAWLTHQCRVFPRRFTCGGKGIFNNRLYFSSLFSGNFCGGGQGLDGGGQCHDRKGHVHYPKLGSSVFRFLLIFGLACCVEFMLTLQQCYSNKQTLKNTLTHSKNIRDNLALLRVSKLSFRVSKHFCVSKFQ